MKELSEKLDNIFIKTLELKDFMQTICDALQYNADEVQDGTHVLSAIHCLLKEFEILTDDIENVNQKVMHLNIHK